MQKKKTIYDISKRDAKRLLAILAHTCSILNHKLVPGLFDAQWDIAK